MEELVIQIVCAAAMIYLVQWFVRNLIVKTNEASCTSCESCSTESDSETHPPANATSHHS